MMRRFRIRERRFEFDVDQVKAGIATVGIKGNSFSGMNARHDKKMQTYLSEI